MLMPAGNRGFINAKHASARNAASVGKMALRHMQRLQAELQT